MGGSYSSDQWNVHPTTSILTLSNDLLEDPQFKENELACFIISKIYYNLQDYDKALEYALKSDSKFNLQKRDLYAECIINRCIELYKTQSKFNY